MNKADAKGYYAALNIAPGASQDEIRLAYVMLKQAASAKGRSPHPKVREAYETLKNPEQHQRYDQGEPSRFNPFRRPDGTSRLQSVPLLIGLVVLLVGVLIYTAGPAIKTHYTHFEVGDELYWKATSEPFGSIEKYTEAHLFPDGTTMAAYRIVPESGEASAWYPAKDLHYHTAPR